MDQRKSLCGIFRDFFYKWLIAWFILIIALAFTILATISVKNEVKNEAYRELEFISNDLSIKISARLRSHAQLLRSGAAYITASDTVTREEWRKFNEHSRISKNLPGIQGIGYSLIISKEHLPRHIQAIKNSGFPDYVVYPQGERELYSTIVYLEPFTGRNLNAFGYDMFSDPVRRKAMEIARDSDIAMLSGKVILVQETIKNIQAGTLMYVPVYRSGMPLNTVEERRAAIKGWVYSPYRMNDLMTQILGNWDVRANKPISLKIYDEDNISEEGLLFDSQHFKFKENLNSANLNFRIPIDFNGKLWTLVFTQSDANINFFSGKVFIVMGSGIIISFLIFAISLGLIHARYRARHILQLNLQLEKINKEKDRFISVLAHDLRNPFNTLLGFSDLLIKNLKKYEPQKIEYMLNSIYNTARQTFNLLNDLLIWARSQAGKLPFEPKKIDVQELINELIENLQILADAKNIQLIYVKHSEIEIFADYNMLKTILRNLISNAIKFTNEGGKVEISVEKINKSAQFKVSDNGIGISKEAQKSIFEHIITSSSGTSNEKGTGWGLQLCRDFVIKHGGNLWVESEPDKGANFYFTLPEKN